MLCDIYYIPAATTDKRCADGAGHCKGVIQTNNVEVDDRGYIYIVDCGGSGTHILELTGAARAIAAFKWRKLRQLRRLCVGGRRWGWV